MLKIAEYNTKTGNKIDLKELEQFGLQPIINSNEKNKEISIEGFYNLNWRYNFGWCIFKKKKCNKILKIINRVVCNKVEKKEFVLEYDNFVDVDLLYDLIEAGYIIKEER